MESTSKREREKDHIHLSVTLSALRTWSFVCGVKYKKAKKHKWTTEKKSKKKLKKGIERAIKKITSEILIRTRARTPMAMADIEKGSPNKR